MEKFIALSSPTEKEVSVALLSYMNSAGVPQQSVQMKQEFVSKLLRWLGPDGVYRNWNQNVQSLAVTALKTCSREPTGCEELFSQRGIEILMNHGALNVESIALDTPVTQESLKALSNLLLQRQDLVPSFAKFGGVESTVAKLKASNMSDDTRAVCLRLLFLLTVLPTHVRKLVDELNVLDVIKSVFDKFIPVDCGSPIRQLTPMPMMALNEALKVLFNLMMHYETATQSSVMSLRKSSSGLSARSQDTMVQGEESHIFDCFIPQLIHTLTYPLPTPPTPPLSPPHSHAINVLINFNPSASSKFWIDANSKHLDVLLDMLDKQTAIKKEEIAGSYSLDQVLPPLLLLLRNLAKSDKAVKEEVKKRLMPENLDRNVPAEHGTMLAHRLIRYLTSVEAPTVKNCTEELLFELCDHDASALTRYVGFGSAAGFLVNKGLLSQSFAPNSTTSKPTGENRINPITGLTETDEDEESEFDKMTDEEKEKEAERLFVLFEKLNKTGVIKVLDANTGLEVTRNGNGNGASGSGNGASIVEEKE
ncbi:guanine nucleotide exchange factor [Paraphysoderma sedebokerense]|nr:guanine nucleotide exchange factor [Paraphysoderma sedebokerense]